MYACLQYQGELLVLHELYPPGYSQMAPECTDLDINLLELALPTQSGASKSFYYWSSILTTRLNKKITLNINQFINPATNYIIRFEKPTCNLALQGHSRQHILIHTTLLTKRSTAMLPLSRMASILVYDS